MWPRKAGISCQLVNIRIEKLSVPIWALIQFVASSLEKLQCSTSRCLREWQHIRLVSVLRAQLQIISSHVCFSYRSLIFSLCSCWIPTYSPLENTPTGANLIVSLLFYVFTTFALMPKGPSATRSILPLGFSGGEIIVTMNPPRYSNWIAAAHFLAPNLHGIIPILEPQITELTFRAPLNFYCSKPAERYSAFLTAFCHSRHWIPLAAKSSLRSSIVKWNMHIHWSRHIRSFLFRSNTLDQWLDAALLGPDMIILLYFN